MGGEGERKREREGKIKGGGEGGRGSTIYSQINVILASL